MSWIANLSNGATLVETEPEPGKPSPWQQLLQYCRDNGVHITCLRLNVGNVLVEAMPPKMCDGYFHAYEVMRILWRDQAKKKQGIGSIMGENVYITWVDTVPGDNGIYYVNQEVRSLKEVKIHTTLA